MNYRPYSSFTNALVMALSWCWIQAGVPPCISCPVSSVPTSLGQILGLCLNCLPLTPLKSPDQLFPRMPLGGFIPCLFDLRFGLCISGSRVPEVMLTLAQRLTAGGMWVLIGLVTGGVNLEDLVKVVSGRFLPLPFGIGVEVICQVLFLIVLLVH